MYLPCKVQLVYKSWRYSFKTLLSFMPEINRKLLKKILVPKPNPYVFTQFSRGPMFLVLTTRYQGILVLPQVEPCCHKFALWRHHLQWTSQLSTARSSIAASFLYFFIMLCLVYSVSDKIFYPSFCLSVIMNLNNFT